MAELLRLPALARALGVWAVPQPIFLKELRENFLRYLAGFTHEDDRLPEFFYQEPVPPKGYTARFRPEDLGPLYERLHQGS